MDVVTYIGLVDQIKWPIMATVDRLSKDGGHHEREILTTKFPTARFVERGRESPKDAVHPLTRGWSRAAAVKQMLSL